MGLQFKLELPRRDFNINLEGDFGDETIGVFGASGAGKTSLFSMLNGLEKPLSGKIVLNGRVLVDTDKGIYIPANKRQIGVVFQEKFLFPHMTIKDNLLYGVDKKRDNKNKLTLTEIADLLNLKDFLDSYPSDISGGEQQRTAIGRALLTSPEMLLLDEPFNAVDTKLRVSILPYLKKIGDELDIPILVISHDLPDIQKLTNKVYLIDKGKNLGFGDIITLLNKDFETDDIGFVNTFKLSDTKIKDDLYESSLGGGNYKVLHSVKNSSNEFILTLKPNEISISNKFIDNVSIQNQLPGVIKEIIYQKEGVLCIISGAVDLAVKISKHSLSSLNLGLGDNVYTLFKANSLNY